MGRDPYVTIGIPREYRDRLNEIARNRSTKENKISVAQLIREAVHRLEKEDELYQPELDLLPSAEDLK